MGIIPIYTQHHILFSVHVCEEVQGLFRACSKYVTLAYTELVGHLHED